MERERIGRLVNKRYKLPVVSTCDKQVLEMFVQHDDVQLTLMHNIQKSIKRVNPRSAYHKENTCFPHLLLFLFIVSI